MKKTSKPNSWRKRYEDWQWRHFPNVTRWWHGLSSAERWVFRVIAILVLVEAIRL